MKRHELTTKNDRSRHSGIPPQGAVWVRISAFLALRSPNTQETYAGIVREWCEFLGHPPGSAAGGEAMKRATDMHAIAFRRWLSERPGERPRGAKARGDGGGGTRSVSNGFSLTPSPAPMSIR